MCNRSIPNFKFCGELSSPWEPFRLQGLVLAEGIRLGPPPLARPAERSQIPWWEGGEGRRMAWGAGRRPRVGHVGGGSTCGFLQSRHPTWKAFLAGVDGGAGPLAALPGVAVAGPSRSGPPAHFLPSGTSEKN